MLQGGWGLVQRWGSEFRRGWDEASWGDYFVLALIPVGMGVSLLAYLIEGRISSPPGPLFWILTVLTIPICLVWAGLRSGLGNWLWRLVFAVVLVLLIGAAIRQANRAGIGE